MKKKRISDKLFKERLELQLRLIDVFFYLGITTPERIEKFYARVKRIENEIKNRQ